MTSMEQNELTNILVFLQKTLGQSLEYLADAYLFINQMVLEEQYYFVRHGKYRNTTFEEVNRQVYQNQEYMAKYMTGLPIADYLWAHHLELIRYFMGKLSELGIGENYLEIGPGFGQYLIRAVHSGQWNNYLAVDISPTSVRNCRSFLSNVGIGEKNNVSVEVQDFLHFSPQKKFDCIVCGEVMEHVEAPCKMLEKIHTLLSDGGCVFITTVMNSSTIDHIYLFSTRQEILELVQNAGFKVKDYICTTAKNMTVDKAEKKKMPVYIGLVLQKA